MSLETDPFSYEVTQAGRVRIFRGGGEVVVVRGAAASALISRLWISADADQQALARATGNYKRGNERR